MEERRKNRRMELSAQLEIRHLNGSSEPVSIEVVDVSKTGVGFISDSLLSMGAVYEALLTIWTKEVLHSFIEIVRIEKMDNGQYNYGTIFIGMPEMDSMRIEIYDKVNTMEDGNEQGK